MSDLDEPSGLVPPRSELRTGSGSAAIYAAAAGAVSAVPVPFLDGILGGIARGSAMRRVASRHQVILSREARAILAGIGLSRPTSTGGGRFLRSALSRALAPVRLASRAEDAGATFLSTLVFDHYLRTSGRILGAPIGEAEALRIRTAMEDAFSRAGIEALRGIPMVAADSVMRAGKAAVRPDLEDRGPVERFVDTLLDTVADTPRDVLQRVCDLFDEALAASAGRR